MTNTPRHKPVTLEKRKSLLYNTNKRRSIKTIVFLSLVALVVGFAIAYVLKGIVEIDVSALDVRDRPVWLDPGAA